MATDRGAGPLLEARSAVCYGTRPVWLRPRPGDRKGAGADADAVDAPHDLEGGGPDGGARRGRGGLVRRPRGGGPLRAPAPAPAPAPADTTRPAPAPADTTQPAPPPAPADTTKMLAPPPAPAPAPAPPAAPAMTKSRRRAAERQTRREAKEAKREAKRAKKPAKPAVPDDPLAQFQVGRSWLSVRGGYAKSGELASANGNLGFGLGYSRFVFRHVAVGLYGHGDLLGKFGAAAEIEYPITAELTYHLQWKTALRPYFGAGGGAFLHKYFRT